MQKLQEFFAPEFLNRLDDTLVFNPLSSQAMQRLVEIELNKALTRRGFARHHIKANADEDAIAWLEEHGFSERFGARELKRVLEQKVLTPISRKIVRAQGAHRGKTIEIGVKHGELCFDFIDHRTPSSSNKPPEDPKIETGKNTATPSSSQKEEKGIDA